MALKFKINKETFDALPDVLKDEYSLSGSDYMLLIEGGPDAKASEKFSAERDRRRAAEKRAQDAEAKITELEDQFSDTRAAIDKAERKAADAVKKLAESEKKHVDYITRAEVDAAANKLASDLAPASAKVLFPHVRSRLSLDMADPNAPRVVVLGADGKPSDKKLDDLAKEFRDNRDFAGIIVSSRASGGGASRNAGNVGGTGYPAPGVFGNQPQKPASEMKASELLARIEARKAAVGSQ